MTLSLVRDFELRNSNAFIDVPPTAQRLIGFLALQGPRSVRRSLVSGTLWLDATETRANASLRSAIWRSPVLADGPLVLASNTHVWLREDVQVDLHTAIGLARSMLDAPALDPTMIDLDHELSWFTEDILVGWYDDWLLLERERFRQLRLHVLDQCGELLLRAHRYSEAVQVGLLAVASEPLRESAHRLLVRAHLCEGNLAEALRQYRGYADLLDLELGVRPSAAMDDLISGALAGASTTEWASAPRKSSIASHLSRPTASA
ncbi:MAG TPA: bacterial transcriptional activator domain-containing protein [Nocardioides sp.]|nr:bacterial transcriptional activator domain-containing protein [Nocardioides sp.]